MGLDMYLNKIKKNKILNDETTIRVAEEMYAEDELNKKFFEPFKEAGLTYTYTRWNWKGEETYLSKEIAYWRKANAIHYWLFTNCAEENQKDNDYIIVEKDKIQELIKVCTDVLNDLKTCKQITKRVKSGWCNGETLYTDIKVYESNVAKELLPTQQGFFFGSYEIDDWYKENLEYTVKQLTNVLIETDWKNEVIYYVASY
jgi:hypothetical protein